MDLHSKVSNQTPAKPIAEEGELFATHIGGSATIEGVMMRGKHSWAVAVRTAHGIYVEEHALPGKEEQPAWYSWPIVRGCVSFVQSMQLSFKAMDVAADHAWLDDETVDYSASQVIDGTPEAPSCKAHENPPTDTDTNVGPKGFAANATSTSVVTSSNEPSHRPAQNNAASNNAASTEKPAAETAPEPTLSPVEFMLSVGIGLALGLVLFVAAPVFLSNLIAGELTPENAILWNIVEAIVRIAILVAYVWIVGRTPDMARVFGYHGAEHQTIHCFEHGEPLTPENCARYSRIHVRCGTAFLVMTIIVAIVVNSLVPVAALADALGIGGIARNLFVFASRLVLLPLVAGVSYEVTVRWAGTHPESPLVKVALWPGLQMQKLTTAVPDAGMLACAIEALKRVDACDKREEATARS